MTIFMLLYVSRAFIHGADAEPAIADIVAVARERNAQLGVTGALLFTGVHFSQVLEGTRPAVKELMVSINRDPRHTAITVVREGNVARARFAKWALAYSGPSMFVDRTMARALDEAVLPGRQRGATLLRLLEEFSATPTPTDMTDRTKKT